MNTPKGFFFSGVSSGLKKSRKLDLGLVYSSNFLEGSYFFTDNRVKAAPLILALRKISKNKGRIKAVVVNSGNANCFTGKKGVKDAEAVCQKVSKILGEDPRYVLPSSTGIIGKKLPLKKILRSLPDLKRKLGKDVFGFADAILTTDRVKKVSLREIKIKGENVSILGVAKGAGMIYPKLNQATMLAFIFTDLKIKNELLSAAAKAAVDKSFNSISVDRCRSTNDSVFVLTSKMAPHPLIRDKGGDFRIFSSALGAVCLDLAKRIVKDAEGASKFVTVCVKGARTVKQARCAADAVANSNLFKCALYGANPNWGRVVASLGQAGVSLKENILIKGENLKGEEVTLTIDLKRGNSGWSVYTSDLTPEYIKINARYS